MKIYNVKSADVVVCDSGKFIILPHGGIMPKKVSDRLNCEIKIAANKIIGLGNGCFEFKELTENPDGIALEYVCSEHGLKLVTNLKFHNDSGVIEQINTLTNIGDADITVTSFSSGIMEYCVYSSEYETYAADTRVYLCHNKWQGEAQWQSYNPSELGIYPGTTHCWERANFRIGSHGSWSTADYYPLVLAESESCGKTYFMETEGSHNWCIKIGTYGGYNDNTGITLESVGADESLGGWFVTLATGESYTAERCFMGVANGGFESAVSAMSEFKRGDSTVKYRSGYPPVCFNVYMNCIWGHPDPKRVTPLIDKAADAGCEVFVIDGGWCASAKDDSKWALGDWTAKSEFYSETTLEDLADKIKSAGMIPGIWLELDACTENAFGYKPDEDFLLTRYGKVVGNNGAAFYNFCNPAVCKYLFDRVTDLYNMGFRYIKNDYNQSTGIGCTNRTDSCAEGLRQNADAFYAFIDSLYSAFPDLTIENCCSGALRDDNKLLRRSYLQSTSDQEIYLNNPSIVSGSLALMPPEKAGIWSYPYPAGLEEFMDFRLTDDYTAKMSDGAQTAFNMATAMLGVMYLSGRIDLCDEKNFDLISRGVDFYKRIRKMIPSAHPIYPCGTFGINSMQNYAVGLETDEYLLIAVWNIGCDNMHFEVDLSKYIYDSATVKNTYCADDTVSCDLVDTALKIDFEKKNSAMVVFIKK